MNRGAVDIYSDNATTRSPVWLAWTSISMVFVSALLLFFVGRSPLLLFSDGQTDLDGNGQANLLGWVLGAVVVPLSAILFRHVEATRKESSEYHLSNRGAQEAFKWILVVGILLATLHGLSLIHI